MSRWRSPAATATWAAPGANNRAGDYRSSGCTACHMPYSLSGRSGAERPERQSSSSPTDPDDIDDPERAHTCAAHRIVSTEQDPVERGRDPGHGRPHLRRLPPGFEPDGDAVLGHPARPEPGRALRGFQYPANPDSFQDHQRRHRASSIRSPATTPSTGAIETSTSWRRTTTATAGTTPPPTCTTTPAWAASTATAASTCTAATRRPGRPGSEQPDGTERWRSSCEELPRFGRRLRQRPPPESNYDGDDRRPSATDSPTEGHAIRARGAATSDGDTSTCYSKPHRRACTTCPQTLDYGGRQRASNNTIERPADLQREGLLRHGPGRRQRRRPASDRSSQGVAARRTSAHYGLDGAAPPATRRGRNSCIGCHLEGDYNGGNNNFSNITGARIVYERGRTRSSSTSRRSSSSSG